MTPVTVTTGNQTTASQSRTVPKLITPTPGAVVIDANIWGRGSLNLNTLRTTAKKLASGGVQVWVPTQVLLEWASHAVDDARSAAPYWNRLYRAGLASDRFPVRSSLDGVLESLRKAVTSIPNVTVLSMTGEAAIAGVQDQILGTGPGTSSRGVKTGAVDSSWVRDALAVAADQGTEVLFVTRNINDVRATAEAMDLGVHVRTDAEMFESLFGTVAAPEQLVRRITARLDQRAAPDPERYPAYMESLLPINDIQISPTAFLAPDRYSPVGTSLGHTSRVIAISSVRAVEPSEDAATRSTSTSTSSTVEFTLLVLADVNVTAYEHGADGEVSPFNGVIGPCLVTAQLVADVEDIVQISGGNTAIAETSTPGFADPLEGLRWVLERVPAIIGVELDSDDIENDTFTFTGPEDTILTATRSGYDDWTLIFDLDGADVAISCHHDPGARVWAGRDSFDLRDPYYLSSDDGEATTKGPYAAIGAVWRYVHGT
jgi:hypothetical protein